jgi:plastocyanin
MTGQPIDHNDFLNHAADAIVTVTKDADPDDAQDFAFTTTGTWTYTCTHLITAADPNPLPNTATVTGHDKLGKEVSDEHSASVAILEPGALVVKEGNVFAYPGDTVTFTFAVTNNGNTPLSDVAVTDDRCAPVTGPTQKLDGDQDDLLEVGEKWIFTCSKQIPADHEIGDENPIHNIATATCKDELGKTVTAQDSHDVRVLHPAIDIEKTGPATATVGDALHYTLTVTNPATFRSCRSRSS